MTTPKSKLLSGKSFRDPLTIPFLVHGQGVYVFESISAYSSSVFSFVDKSAQKGLRIEFANGYVHVSYKQSLAPLVDPTNNQGLVSKPGAFYWCSLDSQNQRLYAGIGEPRLETMVYQYTFSPSQKEFLESLVFIQNITTIPKKLLRDPITQTVPLLVKSMDSLTMNDIASGKILPSANLSLSSQKLYDCIAGKRFVLDDEDFPEFSQAIEHSIRTPGCWCNRRLKEKANEFSKDPQPLETYLRITLGENNGESPGIPYVMEIWPIGHYSPIHSHADANAVIRVLHGNIHVELYPFLCDGKSGLPPFGSADFEKDDITWISPTLNQIHKLTNLSTNTETCITIQCYMYDDTNEKHYDYFDYLDPYGVKKQYTPDSDMDFRVFKSLMKTEWLQAQKRAAPYKLEELYSCKFKYASK